MKSIDWNKVRVIALDCLTAIRELQSWADRSQQTDYDADAATLHLAAIEKARATFWRSVAILPMGMDLSTTDPLCHFPIFDQLALASAVVSTRPDFGSYATAHEKALGLLIRANLHITESLKRDFAIEDLHNLSPKELRDTLCQLEKKDSIRSILETSDQLYTLSAWIQREWAAVSVTPPASEKAKTTQGLENHYLGIMIGDRVALRNVDGKTMTASFGRKIKPWEMFYELYHAGHDGLARAEIDKKLWQEQTVTDNALDQHKATVNEVLETISVEIMPDNRGVWRLAELNS